MIGHHVGRVPCDHSQDSSEDGSLFLAEEARGDTARVGAAEVPTLAEVRWSRKLPFGKPYGNGVYFVGLKFVF